MRDPLDQREAPQNKGASTALKIVGGIAAFFALLCVGFVFFIAVVCGT
jgi:hypothetical protein